MIFLISFCSCQLVLIRSTRTFPIPDTLEIQELTRYPFINREEGSGTREQLEEYIKKHHIHLKSSWEQKRNFPYKFPVFPI